MKRPAIGSLWRDGGARFAVTALGHSTADGSAVAVTQDLATGRVLVRPLEGWSFTPDGMLHHLPAPRELSLEDVP